MNELAPGTTRGKWKALLAVLAVAVPLVAPYQYAHFFGEYTPHNARELMNLQLQRAHWALWGTGIAEIGFLYAVIAVFRFGRDTLRAERYPPPGYAMPFTTRVVEGARARFQGHTYQFTALLLFVAGLALFGFAVWDYLQISALASRL